jgi:hypothetical protein
MNHKGAPIREGAVLKNEPIGNRPQQLLATFKNTGDDPAMENAVLYYDEAQYWGKLGPNDPQLRSNTYEGHRYVHTNSFITMLYMSSKTNFLFFGFSILQCCADGTSKWATRWSKRL